MTIWPLSVERLQKCQDCNHAKVQCSVNKGYVICLLPAQKQFPSPSQDCIKYIQRVVYSTNRILELLHMYTRCLLNIDFASNWHYSAIIDPAYLFLYHKYDTLVETGIFVTQQNKTIKKCVRGNIKHAQKVCTQILE